MAGEFATDFDGSSDDFSRGSDLAGNADGKKGIFSTWLRIDGGDGSAQYLLSNTGFHVGIYKTTTSIFLVQLKTSVPAVTLDIRTTGTIVAGSGWHHILASWDLATTTSHLYLDDVSDQNTVTRLNNTIDYTGPAWGLGAYINGMGGLNGAASEFYFNTAEYLDLSVETNRRKFISASGKPTPPGVTGELPTTNQPIIYCPDGDATNNLGSGGNFTKYGAPVRVAGPGRRTARAALISGV